jgi:hypothetical protein
MSWADDIRCLYCDGRLPLYRKITNGQFCSAAHRKGYWQEQERLAVERLHQTHDSLQAFKPRVSVEAILGKIETPIELPAEALAAAALEGFEPNAPVERPGWLTFANSGNVPTGLFVLDTTRVQPRWLADRVVISYGDLLPATIAPRMVAGLFRVSDPGFASAPRISIPLFGPVLIEAKILAPGVAATHFTILPVRRLELLAGPLTEPIVIEEAPPALLVERLFALRRIAAVLGNPHTGELLIEPLALVFRTHLPLYAELVSGSLRPAAMVRDERLRELPVNRIALAPAPVADSLRAVDLRATAEAPQLALSTPPIRPRLRLAAGRRYTVQTPGAILPSSVPAQRIEPTAMNVSLPRRPAKVTGAASNAPDFEPGAAGLIRLEGNTLPSDSASVRFIPSVLQLPQPPLTEPVRPFSHLEPHGDFMANPPVSAGVLAEAEPGGKRVHVWTHTIDFWNRAPRDLKMLAFAIPLLLGLALHPALPKVRVSAPQAASGLKRDMKKVVNTQLASFKQSVFERAAVALDEDFRSGLDDWGSRGDVATEWSFDATGFVRPGPLALYRPSMNLTDYQVQFLGMIDKKALSWVVRAADFDNYYVVKLEVLKPGPLPTIGVTRYAVVNGQANTRADVLAPIDARNDMLYRVRLDVHGDEFSLYVQGQLIDAWSEPRLPRGGIGFFSAHGEESRVRWVQVTHQYDMLGRLCAYLAPYNIPSTTGSWQP